MDKRVGLITDWWEMPHTRAGGKVQRPYQERVPRFEILSADFDSYGPQEMKDAEAVRSSAHMFSGLVQVHEDEGRFVVISVFHRTLHSRCMTTRQPKD